MKCLTVGEERTSRCGESRGSAAGGAWAEWGRRFVASDMTRSSTDDSSIGGSTCLMSLFLHFNSSSEASPLENHEGSLSLPMPGGQDAYVHRRAVKTVRYPNAVIKATPRAVSPCNPNIRACHFSTSVTSRVEELANEERLSKLQKWLESQQRRVLRMKN